MVSARSTRCSSMWRYSVLMRTSLSSLCHRLGVPSRLVIFPDENHWVLNHQNRYVSCRALLLTRPDEMNSLKWHYEVFRWLGKYSKSD